MGSCLSCQSKRLNQYGQRKLTKEEIRNFIFESQKYQNRETITNTIKSEKSCPDLIPKFAKLQIREDFYTDENASPLDELLDFEAGIFDNKENSDIISVHDPYTEKGIKRKVGEDTLLTTGIYLEKKIRTDDESFIYNPLTADDVIEVLSNPGASSDLTFSPLSLTSDENQQFNQEFPNQNEEFNPYNLKTIPEITINTEKPLLESTFVQNETLIRRDRRITEPRHNPRVVSSSVVEVVLNNVPSQYEVIKNRKKSGRFWKSYRRPNETKNDKMLMESYDLPRENILTFLFQKNEMNQNIIHLMVLNNDLVNIKTVLECLQELNTLRRYIDSVDKRANPPVSYAVAQGNVHMVECLLKYQAVLPSIIYSAYDKTWTPTLHLAFRFSFVKNHNNSSFKSSLLYIICEHLSHLENKKILNEFLETKDCNDVNLLHQMILQYYPPGITEYEHYPSKMIRYIIQIGANPELKCTCPTQFDLKVDAVGQALFSIHPWYTLELLLTAPQLKRAIIQDRYIIRERQYTLLDIIDLRQGIDLSVKQAIRRMLLQYLMY